jgi:AhpD family alkylhydroperoxidase
MTKAMANSPALLAGYIGLNAALNGGVLPAKIRESIALAVGQENSCGYCLSAHTYLAEHVARLGSEAIVDARKAVSDDPKTAAILEFAIAVTRSRGQVEPEVTDRVRAAGVSDAEIAETVGHVALNVLTNYFNNFADVEIDFPVVTA